MKKFKKFEALFVEYSPLLEEAKLLIATGIPSNFHYIFEENNCLAVFSELCYRNLDGGKYLIL